MTRTLKSVIKNVVVNDDLMLQFASNDELGNPLDAPVLCGIDIARTP